MVGRTIRMLREDAGVKQYELAARASVHPVTLNRIEKGRANPDLATLRRLADALRVPLARLFSDADSVATRPAANTPAA